MADPINLCSSVRQFFSSSINHQILKGRKRKTVEREPQKDFNSSFKNEEVRAAKKSETVSMVTSGGDSQGRSYDKLRKDQKMDSSKMKQCEGKDQKMDNNRMKECSIILKKLMTHPVGWVFNQPVDPAKLKIPDYFSIITKPMDLGTIKCKLERKLYLSPRQFAADVRQTFSNAMRYNPPGNEIHIMAKELDNIFGIRWKSLEAKWRQEAQDSKHQHSVILETEKQNPTSIQVGNKKLSCNTCSLPRRSLTRVAELKSRKDLPDGKTRVRMCRANLNSDSRGEIVVAENDTQSFPCPSIPPAFVGKEVDNIPFGEPLSPNKALRAAMLKSRFADTILKAQQKVLLNYGEKVDPKKMQREREKLEKAHKEEKARIEAQMKVETELKMKREREREAARLALQKMEKTVDIDENSRIWKDLKLLSCSLSENNLEKADEMMVSFMYGVELQSHVVRPLERLGLFMKIDSDDDDLMVASGNAEVEEGEICSS